MKIEFNRKTLTTVLLVFTALIYINTLQNGFVYDDHGVVEDNQWITDVKYLPNLLTSTIWGYESGGSKSSEYFRPMTQIAYMIQYHIFGFKPWGWHLVNGLLHMLNALMVFIVARRLFISLASSGPDGHEGSYAANGGEIEGRALIAAFVSAIIFAAHPVNVEPVAWIACIGELMYMLFAMSAFYIYMLLYPTGDKVLCERDGGKRVWLYLFALFLYLLATLSKETGLTLPAVIVVYDFVRKRSFKALPFRNYVPFVLVAIGYLLLRSHALKGVSPREAYLEHPVLQALNIFPVMLKFLGKLVLPINLTPAYIYEPILSFSEPLMLVSIIVLTLLAYLLWRFRFSKPWLPVAVVILVAPLTPTFLLLFRDHVLYHIAIPSDRFLYMPVAGAAMIIGFFIARRFNDGLKHGAGRAWVVAVVAVALVFGYATVKRNFVWKSDRSLWEATVEGDPDNYFAHFVLAELNMNDGRHKEAIGELNEVERLRPGYPAVRHRRGMMYFATGEVKLAEADFKEVLRDDQGNSDAHYNLAMIYFGRGEYLPSLEEYERALKTVTAGFMKVKILNGISVLYTAQGEYSLALAALEVALQVDPSNKDIKRNIETLKSVLR